MISLSNAIETLRSELARAIELGKAADIRFNLGEVTIQLEIVAEETDAVEGKVNWWIFSGGGKMEGKDTSRHVLTINLQPTDAKGEPLRVNTQRNKASD